MSLEINRTPIQGALIDPDNGIFECENSHLLIQGCERSGLWAWLLHIFGQNVRVDTTDGAVYVPLAEAHRILHVLGGGQEVNEGIGHAFARVLKTNIDSAARGKSTLIAAYRAERGLDRPIPDEFAGDAEVREVYQAVRNRHGSEQVGQPVSEVPSHPVSSGHETRVAAGAFAASDKGGDVLEADETVEDHTGQELRETDAKKVAEPDSFGQEMEKKSQTEIPPGYASDIDFISAQLKTLSRDRALLQYQLRLRENPLEKIPDEYAHDGLFTDAQALAQAQV